MRLAWRAPSGFDASAHVSEETHDPTRNAPWGILLSVVVSGVAGYALLLAVTLSIGDLQLATRAWTTIHAMQMSL